jgi:poly-D-alanine transfer protein DltD
LHRDRCGDATEMHISKDLIIEELEKQGKSEHVQKALQELPDRIDHEEHAAVLAKYGIDPGKLAADAAKKGLGAL